jgi:hypothetical protein
MTKLLTVEGNPKTAKGEKLGFWTAILHLAPAKLSGFEVCPKATAGCRAACLNTAGHGGLTKGPVLTYADLASGSRINPVQAARAWRTRWLFEAREAFMARLVTEITTHVKRCKAAGFAPAIRLNGTSDIRWEAASFKYQGLSIFEHFPDVQFYDYTKIPNRRNLPANYSVTFSYADGNQADVAAAIARGLNIAVVFASAAVRADYMTSGFLGLPVIDGDETDLRFLDPRQSVVGLYAKGAAKRDLSGFVVH